MGKAEGTDHVRAISVPEMFSIIYRSTQFPLHELDSRSRTESVLLDLPWGGTATVVGRRVLLPVGFFSKRSALFQAYYGSGTAASNISYALG
jgi:hypothetical protein